MVLVAETLRSRTESFTPIGDKVPFEQIDQLDPKTYSLFPNDPPFAENYMTLVYAAKTKPYNGIKQQDGIREVCQESHMYDVDFINWTALRKIGAPEYSLTGFESYFIGQRINGTVNNPLEIAKTIAEMGLQLKDHKPDLVNKLLTTGIKGLVFSDLNLVDVELAGALSYCKRQMTHEARDYRTMTDTLIKNQPTWMNKIYYQMDDKANLHQTLIIPRLPMHEALRNPHSKQFFTEQEMEGRLIMKLIAQGGHPLPRMGMWGQHPLS